MHAETQLARPFALIAAMISGSMLAPAQDTKATPQDPPAAAAPATPARPASPTPTDPPASAPTAPGDDAAPEDADPELLRDALDDFWGDAPTDESGEPDTRAIDGFEMFPGFRPFSLRFDPRAFAGGSGGSMKMQSTTIENGVEKRIHVEVDADGKARATITAVEKNGDKSERKFEADSVDALRTQAPELESMLAGSTGQLAAPQLKRLHDLFGAWPFQDPRAQSAPRAHAAPRGLQRLPRRFVAPSQPGPGSESQGPRLGVQIRAIAADDPLRAHLRLEQNVGLLVESVVPGSLADRLRIERFDVITKIDELPIGDAADVLNALKEADDGLVEVHVLRGGKPLLLTAQTEVEPTSDV